MMPSSSPPVCPVSFSIEDEVKALFGLLEHDSNVYVQCVENNFEVDVIGGVHRPRRPMPPQNHPKLTFYTPVMLTPWSWLFYSDNHRDMNTLRQLTRRETAQKLMVAIFDAVYFFHKLRLQIATVGTVSRFHPLLQNARQKCLSWFDTWLVYSFPQLEVFVKPMLMLSSGKRPRNPDTSQILLLPPDILRTIFAMATTFHPDKCRNLAYNKQVGKWTKEICVEEEEEEEEE